MADYPSTIPLLPILFDRIDPVMGWQFNMPYREIEAICTEIGINPSTIDDTVSPSASPASIAVLLDMYANIVKTQSGSTIWTGAAVPNRRMLAGCGNGGTLASSSTGWLYPGGISISTAEYFTPLLWDGNTSKLYVATQTNQPASGSLVITVRKQHNFDAGNDTTTILTIPAGSTAAVFSSTNSVAWTSDISRRPGSNYPGWTQEGIDAISLKVVNNGSTTSAAIAGWSIEYDQVTIGTQVPPST